MSLHTAKPPRQPIDVPRDKPQVDRVEHANLERPGAVLHPRARGWAAQARAADWKSYTRAAAPSWR